MFKSVYNNHLDHLHNTQKYRQLPDYRFNQNGYIDFASNDYLGLCTNKALLQAAIAAGEKFGVGASGSRLISGNIPIFEQLEDKIASDKNTKAALFLNTGFQTNFSVLASLLAPKTFRHKPLVLLDRLNHSSIYQALFLSGCDFIRYRHNDMQHLGDTLNKFKHRTKFIISETLFGMDGDITDLQTIIELATRHKAFVYLDEAHATGILGSRGYGLSTTVDMNNIPHVIMGTFSKALGVSGGYIACDTYIKEYLVNTCPGIIYSTANSPMVAGAGAKSWQLIGQMRRQRQKLLANGRKLKKSLQKMQFNTGHANSHIITVIIGSEADTIRAHKHLLAQGIHLGCIRPPTVPPKTSRLRIALTTKHTDSDIDNLITAMATL